MDFVQVVEEVQQASCPFMERSYLEWIYIGPVLLLLGTNTFFLVSIFYVVVTKLRSTGADFDGQVVRGRNSRVRYPAADILSKFPALL